MKLKTALSLLLLLVAPFLLLAQTSGEKAILVISGGGARGAWGGGLAQALQESGKDYRVVLGTSTGSLLAPLAVVDSFELLKEAYTSVTHKDIFNVRPFKTKGPKKGQLRGLNTFWRILIGKKTLGETKPLKRLIDEYMAPDIYRQIKNPANNLEVIVTVVNLIKDKIEYKSSNDYDREQMIDWVWASANQPVFMSLYQHRDETTREKNYYVDGGVKENVPIREALIKAREIGARHIDVIIHSTERPKMDSLINLRIMKLLTRTIDMFSTEVRENDVDIAFLLSEFAKAEEERKALARKVSLEAEEITVTIYYMSEEDYNLIPNNLLFEKKPMSQLWESGYRSGMTPNYVNRFRFNINGKDIPLERVYER